MIGKWKGKVGLEVVEKGREKGEGKQGDRRQRKMKNMWNKAEEEQHDFEKPQVERALTAE